MRELARRDGRFGLIRILEKKRNGARLYCIEDSVQTKVRADGVSVFGHIHAAKLLLRGAKKILIIGGAGGSLATMLARVGHSVTVVEVDPAAEDLARAYFDLDARIRWVNTEPFAFLEAKADTFDAVFVDACDANGLAAPFAEPKTLLALLNIACPAGSLVANLVPDDGVPSRGGALAAALAALGARATLYGSEEALEGNEILHLRKTGATDTLEVHDIQSRPVETRTYLMTLRAYSPKQGPHHHNAF